MIGIVQAFAPTYARARTQFLEAAATASLPIESHRHPLLGRDGEGLNLVAGPDALNLRTDVATHAQRKMFRSQFAEQEIADNSPLGGAKSTWHGVVGLHFARVACGLSL